eukprot:9406621-Pyramimonas_sp.AAC.1
MAGKLFFDGSCFRHPIADLCRAGWGVSRVDDEGCLLSSVFGPVHAPLPQSAPASEFVALGMASLQIVGPAEGHSDCLAVVKHYQLPAAE